MFGALLIAQGIPEANGEPISIVHAQYGYTGNHNWDSTQPFGDSDFQGFTTPTAAFFANPSQGAAIGPISTDNGLFSASVNASGTSVHANASLSIYGDYGDTLSAYVSASSETADQINIAPAGFSPTILNTLIGSSLVETFSIHGTLSSGMTNPPSDINVWAANASASVQADAVSYATVPIPMTVGGVSTVYNETYQSHGSSSWSGSVDATDPQNSNQSINATLQVTIPTYMILNPSTRAILMGIDPNAVVPDYYNPFNSGDGMTVGVELDVAVSAFAMRYGLEGELENAAADLSNTVTLTGMGLVDASGNPIPLSDYTMTSASGIIYPSLFDSPQQPAGVPEPGSLTLLVSGGFSMAIVAAHRRQPKATL